MTKIGPVLVLSFHTPPTIRPQAILIGKMLPEWLRQGVRPVLLSYRGPDWELPIPHYRVGKLKFNRWLSQVPGYKSYQEKKYYRQEVAHAAEIIKQEKCNLIFSFANPPVSNVLGARLKLATRLPFVSHFSDPWYDNAYQIVRPRVAKHILEQETLVVEQSDQIVFVSEQLRDLVMKKYPEHRTRAQIVPHSFNPADYPSAVPDLNFFTISHIGVFYPQRNPEILFRVLKKILAQKPELRKTLRLRLVGGVNNYAGFSEEKILKMIAEFSLSEITELVPTVSYLESLRLMKESNCLVVIDANFQSSPFLPSKVIDYAGSDRPIVGITPNGSPTMDFLKKLGHGAFTYSEPDQAADFISSLMAGGKLKTNQTFLSQFDITETTAKLMRIFQQVIPQ